MAPCLMLLASIDSENVKVRGDAGSKLFIRAGLPVSSGGCVSSVMTPRLIGRRAAGLHFDRADDAAGLRVLHHDRSRWMRTYSVSPVL